MKKIIIWSLLLIVTLALIWVTHYAFTSFPIISGFDAKQVCNCTFVANRTARSLDTGEMAEFPFSLARYEINRQDLSVTTSIWGLVKRKAIYRKGIGCTLITGITEQELRSQAFIIPPPIESKDSMPWPLGNSVADTMNVGINQGMLKSVVDEAFTEPYPGKKQRTRAVIVVYNGQLVAEQYAPGFNQNTKMYGWSMAKSITGALIGTLVKQGYLDVKQPAPVPEWKDKNDPRHSITLENLLQQTSGLDFLEDYTKASDATYMIGREKDMAAFTANHSLAHKPGTVFNYSSGNSNILSRIIRQTVGEKDYAAYPATALFYKIGMYHTLFEPDCSGTYVGSSYINATARDYARFGLLYCNDGVWRGERILPEGWVKQTVTAPETNKDKDYGYQFWLNGINYNNPSRRIYPDVPADMFFCDGYAGQAIYIIPSKKLVVVRLGLTLDRSFNENAFLSNIINTINNER
ncbi:MAG: serine hydrolase [Williamsia sp.]|nr:serine hydrolase [Williamsia sp.]